MEFYMNQLCNQGINEQRKQSTNQVTKRTKLTQPNQTKPTSQPNKMLQRHSETDIYLVTF